VLKMSEEPQASDTEPAEEETIENVSA